MQEKFKICVAGSAVNNCSEGAVEKALQIGAEIARQGAIVLTGATGGVPEAAARGARRAGGVAVGLSPAATRREHVQTYKLSEENLDIVIYTGFDISGRNVLLTRSADAVIEVCGHAGALDEFTIAVEDGKIIGVLLGTGGVAQEIKHILKAGNRGRKGVVFDTDPKRLVRKILELLKAEHKSLKKAPAKSGRK